MAAWPSIQIPNVTNQDLRRVPASPRPNAFATWHFEKPAWAYFAKEGPRQTMNDEWATMTAAESDWKSISNRFGYRILL